jgi:hypothetical protein
MTRGTLSHAPGVIGRPAAQLSVTAAFALLLRLVEVGQVSDDGHGPAVDELTDSGESLLAAGVDHDLVPAVEQGPDSRSTGPRPSRVVGQAMSAADVAASRADAALVAAQLARSLRPSSDGVPGSAV